MIETASARRAKPPPSGFTSTTPMSYFFLLYWMRNVSPLVSAEKLRSDCSSTAFGFEILMKSVVCGWSLTKRPFCSDADLRWTMSPSFSRMFSIIQWRQVHHPLLRDELEHAACIRDATFRGLAISNIIG